MQLNAWRIFLIAFAVLKLNDTCLNNAKHYAAAIKMLFDIA